MENRFDVVRDITLVITKTHIYIIHNIMLWLYNQCCKRICQKKDKYNIS